VDALTLDELSRIVLSISLDTLAGSSRLACLTSGFKALEVLVDELATALRREIAIVPLLLANSDHFNFARRGVPAMRLVAGYNDPTARTRYLLTEGDTLDKVGPDELEAATVVAAELAWQALASASSIAGHKD
jgi:Zn-dependent M28 family amino/carboxypeptidase